MTRLWPPHVLREYSFIADGERGALVGPRGEIVWLCVPSWDSPAAFSSLLGGAGGFAIRPADDQFVWGGYYEPGSLIWHSRWVSRGVTECREALAMSADPRRAMLLRQVQALHGPARMTIVLDVRAAFGRHAMSELACTGGCWTGAAGRCASGCPARHGRARMATASWRCR